MENKTRNKRLTSSAGESPRTSPLLVAEIQLAASPAATPRRQRFSWHAIAVNGAICSFLAVAVALSFAQTAGHEFVGYDDNVYVFQNVHVSRGLTLAGIQRAFTGDDAGNWHPLTWISHMIDCQLFKSWAGGHHLSSAAIHAAVAVLLFLTLLQMTGSRWPSAAVAAVFAVHPLRVESVAWVAERKDVLSGLFFVLTLAAYGRYVHKGESLARYLLVWFLYLLGLMCKPMLVTLPLLLLLLDYWPLGRWGRAIGGPAGPRAWAWTLVVEKLPLLLLSLTSCAVTIFVQEHALKMADRSSFSMRLGNAVVSYAAYLWQFVWPQRLAVLYPNPKSLGPVAVLSSLAILAFISWVVVRQRVRRPYLLVGWLWYLIMLLPVIGLLQVGHQARADRYTYLPLLGPCLAVVWAVADFVRGRRRLRPVASVATCLALALLATAAWRQTTTWRDTLSLWTHALAAGYESSTAHDSLACIYRDEGKFDLALQHYQDALRLSPESVGTRINYGLWLVIRGHVDEGIAQYRTALDIDPGNTLAESNLGQALVVRGDIADAAGHFQRALQIDPENAWASYYLGSALMRQGRTVEATAALERAVTIYPELAIAWNDWANALRQSGRADEALARYRRAIEVKPDYAEAHNNLGLLLSERGQRAEAAEHFQKALEINSHYVQAHNNLGVLLMKQGRLPDAMAHFRAAIALDPAFDLPHANLGRILSQQGQNAAATVELRAFLHFQPDQPQVLGWLAWILATAPEELVRSGEEAVALAQKAVQLTSHRDAGALNTLAAAYAETGRYEEAVRTGQQALTVAAASGSQPLVARIRQCIACYRNKQPVRQAVSH